MRTRLTERDLSRIVRRVINEQTLGGLKPIEDIGRISVITTASDFTKLGGVSKIDDHEVQFVDSRNRTWVVSKEWVWQQKGVDDDPRFIDTKGNGSIDPTFSTLFNERKP